MTSPALESWLRRRFRVEAGMGFLVGLLAVALGLVVMFVTFWLAYAVVWIAGEAASAIVQITGGKRFRIPHDWRLIGAAVFMVLLFVDHLRTSPWERGNYGDWGSQPAFMGAVAYQAGAGASLACLLRYPQASSRMIVEILETGPRCLTGGVAMFRRTTAILQMDVGGCASALAVLMASHGAVPPETLAGYLPSGHEWRNVELQLKLIEGVVFITRGLSLTDELRSELNHHMHAPV
jgi:hypothetical protein